MKIAKKLAKIAILVVATTAALSANAQQASVGWTKAMNNIGDFSVSGTTSLIFLCALGGVGAIGYMGKLLLKKGGDRGDDVEWSKIGYAALGGAVLLAVSLIAATTVETLGGSANDIGKKITLTR